MNIRELFFFFYLVKRIILYRSVVLKTVRTQKVAGNNWILMQVLQAGR